MNTTKIEISGLFHPNTLEDFFHIFQVICVHNQIMYREEARSIIAEIEDTHHPKVQELFGTALYKLLEPALNLFPTEPRNTRSLGSFSDEDGHYKLIHMYTFKEVFHPEPVVEDLPTMVPADIPPEPITAEQFAKADKRSLTRTEWVCVQAFVYAGGIGWGAAIKAQDTLWDQVSSGIIDNIRSGLDKLGWDHKRYFQHRSVGFSGDYLGWF